MIDPVRRVESLTAERDAILAAIRPHIIVAEFDYPAERPEFCGWLCQVCGEMIEDDGQGHGEDCAIAGLAPPVPSPSKEPKP